jgi:hypothetical protein
MKKTLATKKKSVKREALRSEYQFDYSSSKPNRFASKMSERVAVVLEPDVAAVFKSSEDVNALLRSIISALPEKRLPRRAKRIA